MSAQKAAAKPENTGRWTKEEHEIFVKGLEQYGKEWKRIADMVGSRTVVQIRTHAQKYFQKLSKMGTPYKPKALQKGGNPSSVVKRSRDNDSKTSDAASSNETPVKRLKVRSLSTTSSPKGLNAPPSSPVRSVSSAEVLVRGLETTSEVAAKTRASGPKPSTALPQPKPVDVRREEVTPSPSSQPAGFRQTDTAEHAEEVVRATLSDQPAFADDDDEDEDDVYNSLSVAAAPISAPAAGSHGHILRGGVDVTPSSRGADELKYSSLALAMQAVDKANASQTKDVSMAGPQDFDTLFTRDVGDWLSDQGDDSESDTRDPSSGKTTASADFEKSASVRSVQVPCSDSYRTSRLRVSANIRGIETSVA